MKLAALIILGALVAMPGCFADEASKKAKAAELLDLMNGRQIVDQVFASVKQMIAAQTRQLGQDPKSAETAKELNDRVMALMQKRFNWDDMRPEYEKIYAESFSEAELDGIVNFYKSPTGKAMIEKMPVLMQKSMVIAQSKMKDLGPEIEKMVRDTLDKSPK